MHDEGLTPKESSEAIRVASVTAMLFMSRCLGIDFSKMAKAVQSTIKDGSAEYAMKQIEDFIEKMNAMSVKKDLH